MADQQPHPDAHFSPETSVRFGASIEEVSPIEPGSDSFPKSALSSIPGTPGWSTPATPGTGAQTPDPLLGHQVTLDHEALRHHPGLSADPENIELGHKITRRASAIPAEDKPTEAPASPSKKKRPGVPPEVRSFTAEIILVMICSVGLMLFAFFLGDMLTPQEQLKEALGINSSELPWIVGAFNTANALSVVVSGSLSDLAPPKALIVGAFGWLAAWNVVGVFSLTPSRYILFFIVRAMQGLAIGVLVSGSMSIMGRIYSPGVRKNKVFSVMAATSPFGYTLGSLQGGALSAHLKWIFGTNAILSAFCAVAALIYIPSLRPAADQPGADPPTLRQFDYIGAALAAGGSVCLLFGLTQGPVASWSPYTYALIIVGVLLFVAFFFWENKAPRPLIPNRLWKTPGFTPLMIAYFLGFGSFFGVWQFYVVQFWLRIQGVAPITVALYYIPNAVIGVFAAWLVSRTIHIFPGHYIYAVSMIAFTMGPVFFIPQTPNTLYWALSFPGIILVTFGPDLSFAAASIFITSNVPRSYQGSAASLLVTNQNLSSAIMTSVADAIGTRVDPDPSGSFGLKGLRDIWWFAFATQLLAAIITIVWVRIPKEEEKEHVL